MNGLLIDCSRLMERHGYYARLVDFMADWGMNTLLLHFTDDWGCGVRVPGFPEIAMPDALAAAEVRRLIAHAGKRGVQIIPEVETFGHTRYLTDTRAHRHLYAGPKRGRTLSFNAVDPVNPRTFDTMARLLAAVVELFPSRYIHLGCDEVDMADWCRGRGLDPGRVWAEYVNRVIGKAWLLDRVPMIWADHPVANRAIARLLRKDVVLVDWRYGPAVGDTVAAGLRRQGFGEFVCAPSLACYLHTFLPAHAALENTRRMARIAARRGALGVINTMWCPWRYLQDAMWYGIAWSGWITTRGGQGDRGEFNAEFAGRVLGCGLAWPVDEFLDAYPAFEVPRAAAQALVRGDRPEAAHMEHLAGVNETGRRILDIAERFVPPRNPQVWRAMTLAARAAWVVSERVLAAGTRDSARRARYNRILRDTIAMVSDAWDATRNPRDPQKLRPRFNGHTDQYALPFLRSLGKL
jgi:hypothetical protein